MVEEDEGEKVFILFYFSKSGLWGFFTLNQTV